MAMKIMSIYLIAGFISLQLLKNTFAQNQDDNPQDLWDPVSAGTVSTWTAPLCGKAKFVIQPFLFYNWTRGEFDSEGHYDSLADSDKRYQFQEQLFMQYGITERLEIDAQIVYQQNYAHLDGNSANTNGLGDSYLFLRYCLIEENSLIPYLTGLFQLKFPTAKFEQADPDKLGTDLMGATSGGGSYDHGYGLIMTKKLKPFLFHADFIYSFPLKVKVDGVKTKYANYLNYDFGLEYFLPKGFNLMLEFNGFLQPDKREDGRKVPASDISYLTVSPGVGWSSEKIQTILAYQRTITGTNTDANDSMVLSFVYTF